MNERIEPVAGLRDYFRDLDRVAPAEGQLTAVVARTAGLGQRPAWQTRLPRGNMVGAIGQEAPLRYAVLAIALVLLMLALALSGGAPRTPFEGRWTSIDPGDGSTQVLDVSGGSTPSVRFEDPRAMGCAAHADDSIDFIARGRGVVTAGRLEVVYADGGGCHTWRVPAFSSTFVLDPTSRTIRDGDGLVWRRSD